MRKTVFYTSIFILSWLYCLANTDSDWDLWARLAVGKIFFQLGHVIKSDIFSYTPTKSVWIDHEWGSGVIFYFIADHFGDAGIYLLKIIITFLIMVLISKTVELQNKDIKHTNLFFYILILMGMFYCFGANIRCQLFTFVFFALWIYVLEKVRRGENRLLWIIPATTLVWANLHGGFVAGLGLLVIYGVGELLNKKPFKKYFLILIPSALISLINPYGFQYWEFLANATTMSRFTITEWRPTGIFPLDKWKGFKIFAAFAIVSFLFGLIKNLIVRESWINKLKSLDKVKYLLIIITFYLAMAHNKHQALFIISSASFLYHDFYGIFCSIRNVIVKTPENFLDKTLKVLATLKDIALYSFIIIFGSVLISTKPLDIKVNPYKFPVGAVEFIKLNKLQGNILTVFHWGSYIAWKLYPDNYIAEDGRYEEIYPEHVHLEVYNFNYMASSTWLRILNLYHTDIIVMEKINRNSYEAMLNNPYWRQIFNDVTGAVFVPSDKVRKSYIYPDLRNIKLLQDIIIDKKYETKIDFSGSDLSR